MKKALIGVAVGVCLIVSLMAAPVSAEGRADGRYWTTLQPYFSIYANGQNSTGFASWKTEAVNGFSPPIDIVSVFYKNGFYTPYMTESNGNAGITTNYGGNRLEISMEFSDQYRERLIVESGRNIEFYVYFDITNYIYNQQGQLVTTNKLNLRNLNYIGINIGYMEQFDTVQELRATDVNSNYIRVRGICGPSWTGDIPLEMLYFSFVDSTTYSQGYRIQSEVILRFSDIIIYSPVEEFYQENVSPDVNQGILNNIWDAMTKDPIIDGNINEEDILEESSKLLDYEQRVQQFQLWLEDTISSQSTLQAIYNLLFSNAAVALFMPALPVLIVFRYVVGR